MARTKRRQPYDPNRGAHDRRTTDLLRNAQVVPIEVDDPIEEGGKLIVMRSTRNDPLAWLHARKFIDDAQYHGGRAFQDDFETIQSRPQAVDASQPYVDQSHKPRGISEAYSGALVRLNKAHAALGIIGSPLANEVLIDGKTMREVVESRGLSGERFEKYFRMRFQECLDCLALVYGFAMAIPIPGRGT